MNMICKNSITTFAGKAFLLLLFIIGSAPELIAQHNPKIGDKIKRKKHAVEVFSTALSKPPFIKFTDKNLVLVLGKVDLLQALNEDITLDHDRKDRIVHYLDTCTSLTFRYPETNKKSRDPGQSNLRKQTEQYLWKLVCPTLKLKRFILETRTQQVDKFYFREIETKDRTIDGLLTDSDRLIWMCSHE